MPKGESIMASYRLAMPDWSAVDKAIGGSSYDHAFVLEVDVEIDGVATTVRSPQFNRERPHVIAT